MITPSFTNEKKNFLTKKDKSTKGSIDDAIKPLLDTLNSLPNYYTTSSCSGRIVLINNTKKKTSAWLFVSHDPVQTLSIPHPCWFLQEPPILHVRCKDLDAAHVLLKTAHITGLKKTGIISLDHLTVEVRGNEKMETFVTPDLSNDYVQQLLTLANTRLFESRKRFDQFHRALANLHK